MIALLNKNTLYNTFGVESFSSIEDAINSMAPSLVEYYLEDLKQYCEETYLNRTQIEQTVYIGDYNLYKDYSDNVYLELNENYSNSDQTTSFW